MGRPTALTGIRPRRVWPTAGGMIGTSATVLLEELMVWWLWVLAEGRLSPSRLNSNRYSLIWTYAVSRLPVSSSAELGTALSIWTGRTRDGSVLSAETSST